MVLSFILIQNRQGKTRLAKYYNAYSDDEKIKLKGEVLYIPVPIPLSHIPFKILYSPQIAHLTSHKGPPPSSPPRPKIPIQLRRVPQPQDRLPAVRRPLLLRLRGRKRQRAGVSGSDPFLCRGVG